MTFNYVRTTIAALTFTALALTASSSFAEEAKMPQTAGEHEALAKSYKEQAAQYRKTAEEHRLMASSYKKAAPEVKGQPNPWAQKMSKHCAAISKDSEKLAADADQAATFHSMRAKEIQGK